MKWIFCALMLANLAYLALNLSGEGASWVGAKNSARETATKNAVGWGSGYERKGNPSLRLLGDKERGNQSIPLAVVEQATLLAVSDGLSTCMGLGPFENIIQAQVIAERLTAIGHTVEMTAVDKPTGESDYRVLLPPLSSLQEVYRRHREFKSRGIYSFVITKGVNAQGISLGVFSSNSAAETHRQTLISLGYDVLVRVIPRVNRGYWVKIGKETFPEALLSELDAELIEVKVTEIACMNE